LNTGVQCVRCARDLAFSVPAEAIDTITKARYDAEYYKCNTCVSEDKQKRKEEIEKKRQVKKEKQEAIKTLSESKTEAFRRFWNDQDEKGIQLHSKDNDDIPIVSLDDDERLMWVYITHGITKSESGFKADEESNTICEKELQNIIQRTMDMWTQITEDARKGRITREQESQQLRDLELYRKTLIKKQIGRVNRLHAMANKKWESKKLEEFERMVIDPNYKDPTGNKAARYHLLDDKDEYITRNARRHTQVDSIWRIDGLEKDRAYRIQKTLFPESEEEGEKEAESTGTQ
jgi:hypothetical protein